MGLKSQIYCVKLLDISNRFRWCVLCSSEVSFIIQTVHRPEFFKRANKCTTVYGYFRHMCGRNMSVVTV